MRELRSAVCTLTLLAFLSAQLIPRPVVSRIRQQVAYLKIEESRVTPDSSEKEKTHLLDDHSCDCRNYCPHPDSSELEILQWIENNPIFCKEAGRIDMQPYLASCFFFCCRNCNVVYFNCVLTHTRQSCLKAAYKCAAECGKESLLNIKITGW